MLIKAQPLLLQRNTHWSFLSFELHMNNSLCTYAEFYPSRKAGGVWAKGRAKNQSHSSGGGLPTPACFNFTWQITRTHLRTYGWLKREKRPGRRRSRLFFPLLRLARVAAARLPLQGASGVQSDLQSLWKEQKQNRSALWKQWRNLGLCATNLSAFILKITASRSSDDTLDSPLTPLLTV